MARQETPFSEVLSAPFAEVTDEAEKKPPRYLDMNPALRWGESWAETVLQRDPGHWAAAARAADTYGEMWEFLFPGLSGRTPNFQDMEQAALKDPYFAQQWDELKKDQAWGRDIAKALHGDNPDWNAVAGAYTKAALEDAALAGELPQKRAPTPLDSIMPPDLFKRRDEINIGIRPSPATMASPETDYDRAVGEVAARVRRDAIPGVSRPPLSDDELAGIAWARMRQEQAGEVGKLGPVGRITSRGLGSGMQMATVISPVGRAARALGAAGKAVAPLAEGAALSAVQQGLEMAGGTRTRFDASEVIAEAALMGLGAKAGKALAVRFPESAKLAGTFGMLGTVEAAHALPKILSLPRPAQALEEADFGSLAEQLATTVLTVAVAGKLGAAESAKPGTAEMAAARAREAARIPDYIAAGATGTSIRESIRRMLRIAPEPAKVGEIEKRVTGEVLPSEVEMTKAQNVWERWLQQVSPKDKKRRAAIADAIYKKIESDGRMKLPEGLLTAEEAAAGEAALRGVGKSLLEVGRLAKDRNIIVPEGRYEKIGPVMKREFDAGQLDDGTPVSREAAAAGEYGALQGGFLFHEARGVYFPRETAATPGPTPRAASVPVRAAKGRAGPLAAPNVQRHSQARTQTFEEALASRPLDTTHTRAIEIVQDEARSVRGKARLDIGREEGLVLAEGELPTAAADQARMQGELASFRQRNTDIDRALKQRLDPARQLALRMEKIQNLAAIEDLKAALAGKLFLELKGKQWGDYEGMYAHRALVRNLNAEFATRGPTEYIYDTIHSLFKTLRIGMDTAQIAQDSIGNYAHMRMHGIDIGPYYKRAIEATKNPAKRGDLDHEFDALAERANLGGATDITSRDLRESRFLKEKIEEARRQGNHALRWRLARMLSQRAAALDAIESRLGLAGKVITAPFRVVEGIAKVRTNYVDRAASRAAFYSLRENGIGDSGPLPPAEAFAALQKVMDYGTLPRRVHHAAKLFSTIRFPAKIAQSLATAMTRRPTFMGEPIPTPFDSIIRDAPGSTAAKAALVTRGLTRLAVHAAQPIAVALTAQGAAQAALGISNEKLDKLIEERYDYLPPYARWITRQMFIPTGKSPTGGIEGFDASFMFPVAHMLRYFSIGLDERAPEWYRLAQKSLIAGPIAQMAERRTHTYRNRAVGWGMDERYWPLMEMLMPAAISRPLEAYFEEQNLPPEERDALRGVLRSVVGVPMTVLRNEGFGRALTDKLYSEGVIGLDERDDGSWNYYVKNPLTPEGAGAQKILNALEEAGIDLFSMRMRHQRKLQKIKEAFEQ